jgi:hypothetical protein
VLARHLSSQPVRREAHINQQQRAALAAPGGGRCSGLGVRMWPTLLQGSSIWCWYVPCSALLAFLLRKPYNKVTKALSCQDDGVDVND